MLIPKMNERQLMGILKQTGSRERDVVYAAKETYLHDLERNHRQIPLVCFIMGIGLCVLVIGAPLGIPMILFGFWNRASLKKNHKRADAVVAEYLAQGVPAAAVSGTAPAAPLNTHATAQ